MVNSSETLKTPILFLVFNRPSCTEKVFKAIAAARPTKLYVAADGARQNNPGEADLCAEVRAIATKIDWDCELKILFREKNLGCRLAVSSAIDWFFYHEEEGIILEDDCLPLSCFFEYAASMLERYRHSEKVMHVGGINYQRVDQTLNTSYYFSKIPHVWGWATWRRAWKCYDSDLSGLRKFVSSGKWRELDQDIDVCCYWIRCFYSAWIGEVDTWDYQWCFSIFYHQGLSITPGRNLVENIGFGVDATHTKNGNSPALSMCIGSEFWKLSEPSKIEVNSMRDRYTYRNVYNVKADSCFFLFRWKKKWRKRLKTQRLLEEIIKGN